MFMSLNQGSPIYVLDKTSLPKLSIGTVISVSQPKYTGFGNNQQTIDLKIDINGNTYEYNSIPSNYSIISYNGGKVTLSETKQGLQQEVETILSNSRKVLNEIDNYKQNITSCEEILKELNPQFAKDKERDDKLNTLEQKFTGISDKLDKLILMINK